MRAGGRIVVRFANTGPGIPAADHDRIFQRFYRADSARGGAGGTGLGLSLAREIIRAHGGDLVLEGSDRDLTRFAVELPAADGCSPA